MLDRVIAIGLGFLLDAALGDPHGFPHPVRWIGRLISALEKFLRARFPKS
ncbi:cobalamin biosynthesis protein, partial [Anaerotruncus massiliensis (ex Liu et al. 2021)]